VQVVYGRVTAVFRAAVRDRVIPVSPCDGDVRLPRRRGAAALELLTTDQVLALGDLIAPRYRALVIAGAGTGLRPGELFGLTLDRVDFLRRSVRVDRQMVRVRGGGVELGELKTERSMRSVPLPTVVADALAAHLAQHPAAAGRLVFTNERGAAIRQHPFAMVWATARDKAGLPAWATPHDLRHYYASLLIARGASVKVVQARLGHASAKTTLDTYGHLWPDDEDATRATVDAELSAGSRVNSVSRRRATTL
jgi:integrase